MATIDFEDKVIATLDVGGTSIKANLFSKKTFLLKDYISVSSKSKESKDTIYSNFSQLLTSLKAKSGVAVIDEVLLAFPGPFDYDNGISLLKGVDKYETLFNTDVEKGIMNYYSISNNETPRFSFLNDIDAFALGAVSSHPQLAEGNTLFLVIGTGSGSAFTSNGHLVKESPCIPPNGWIYCLPFKDTIIDDYISERGLERLCLQTINKKLSGLDLYNLANDNDLNALKVFKAFGQNIVDAITPILMSFNANNLVIAGNVGKSCKFYKKVLEDNLPSVKIIHPQDDTSTLIFKGLLRYFGSNK